MGPNGRYRKERSLDAVESGLQESRNRGADDNVLHKAES